MSAPWLTRRERPARTDDVPTWVKDLVRTRAGGFCECCGGPCFVGAHAFHHRRGRGMGGSRDASTNTPCNVVLICGRDNRSGCHGDVHQNPDQSREAGWLVRQGADPARVPILLHNDCTVFLTVSGRYEVLPEEVEAS